MFRAHKLSSRLGFKRYFSDQSSTSKRGGSGTLLVSLAIGAPLGFGLGAAYKCSIDQTFSDNLNNKYPFVRSILNPFEAALKAIGIDEKKTQKENIINSVKEEVTPEIIDNSNSINEEKSEEHIEPIIENIKHDAVDDIPKVDDIVAHETHTEEETLHPHSSQGHVDDAEDDNQKDSIEVHSMVEAHSIPASSSTEHIDHSTQSDIDNVPQVEKAKDASHDLRQAVMSEFIVDVQNQTTAMKSELERNILHDLEHMDAASLKYRVAQLNIELLERVKWEAYRLQEAIEKAEEKAFNKYNLLLAQQKGEIELAAQFKTQEQERLLRDELSAKVMELQAASEKNLQGALIEQADKFNRNMKEEIQKSKEKIEQDLTDDYLLAIARLKEGNVKHLLEVQKDVAAATEALAAINHAVDLRAARENLSVQAHKISAAVLLLENSMHSSLPLSTELTHLSNVSAQDDLIKAVVNVIPKRAFEVGVNTIPELLDRFSVVKEEVRKAALAPQEAPVLFGQMVGNVLACVTMEPKGNVEGDSVEAALARATYFMEKNNLVLAMKEINSIEGYPRKLLQDWESLARDRLIVDQAAKILRAEAALRHRQIT